jgi:2,4-dienoyl-CoA reductase-like NADH-dependent reductase (Old Yellow Enzyme family)
MTSLHDPLTLPCGQVLPNRIMKAALSEGLSNKQTLLMSDSNGSIRAGATVATV